MARARTRQLVGLGVLFGVAGLAIYASSRRTFAADVRAICTAEGASETTIVNGRIVVEGVARKRLKGDDGIALLEAMKSSPPETAAAQLRAATEKAGVHECRAVASYTALATRLALQRSADRLCRNLEPATLAKVPRASRFPWMKDWAHTNVADPALDEMLAPFVVGTLEELTSRLRSALSDLDIHACGMLAGLSSGLDPVAGPNAAIQSVGLQNDPREAAVAADLQTKIPAFRECYAAGVAKNPKLAGTMSFKFRVAETGIIDFALAQEDSTLTAPAVVSCMVEAVKTAHGPPGPAKNPGGLIVTFWVAQ